MIVFSIRRISSLYVLSYLLALINDYFHKSKKTLSRCEVGRDAHEIFEEGTKIKGKQCRNESPSKILYRTLMCPDTAS